MTVASTVKKCEGKSTVITSRMWVLLSLFIFSCSNCSTSEAFSSAWLRISKNTHNYNKGGALLSPAKVLVAANNSQRRQTSSVIVMEGSSSSSSSNNDASLATESFDDLYADIFPDWLLGRLKELGFIYPTAIQKYCLEEILSGDDVIVRAQTGSGKTLCYLLPLLASIDASRSAIQAVILVPTRELGLQVTRVARKLICSDQNIMVMPILQGSLQKRQRAWAWAEPPHIVVGTPKEVHSMVQHGGIRYNAIQTVVVDEFDACLLNNQGQFSSSPPDSGNKRYSKHSNVISSDNNALHELLSKYLSPTYDDSQDSDMDERAASLSTPKKQKNDIAYKNLARQTVFCSATIPQPRHFQQLCIQNQWILSDRKAKFICANPNDTLPPTLTHGYVVCKSERQKMIGLVRTLRKEMKKKSNRKGCRRVLIFCNQLHDQSDFLEQMAATLQKQLSSDENKTINTSILRYTDSLRTRAHAMDTFRGHIVSPQQYYNTQYNSITTPNPQHDDQEDDEDDLLSSKEKKNDENDDGLYILISSDLAARGLDVVDVSHVIHFDLPTDADTYVHRSGRAGRLGRPGKVVTILTSQQEFVLQRLVNQLQLQDKITCLARQEAKPK